MSDLRHLAHLVHSAKHANDQGHPKLAGVVLLVAGFFLAPFLVGIPMMIYGAYLLFK